MLVARPFRRPAATGNVPARRLLRWCLLSARMLRRAPLRLTGLLLLPLLVEAVLQLSIPHVGVIASKFLVPLLSMWALLLVDQFCRDGWFAPRRALSRLYRRAGVVVMLALLAAGIFTVQLGVATLAAGPVGALALATGDVSAAALLGRSQVALILASGTLPSLLLLFTVPRVLLDDRSLRAALAENLQQISRSWRPVLAFWLLSTTLVAAIAYQPLMMLPLLALGYVPYWAYRDSFTQEAN